MDDFNSLREVCRSSFCSGVLLLETDSENMVISNAIRPNGVFIKRLYDTMSGITQQQAQGFWMEAKLTL